MREDRIRYLLRVSKFLLVRAESLAIGESDYLHDELEDLLERTNLLLEKMDVEQSLIETRNVLHDDP